MLQMNLRIVMRLSAAAAIAATVVVLALGGRAFAQQAPKPAEDYAKWPLLRSTFPSTGGGGIIIKGYDPVIVANKCMTTFMAVTPAKEVYYNVAEFEAVPAQGGTLCTNGKFRSFDGKTEGTTPFRFFFKDGVFRAAPQK